MDLSSLNFPFSTQTCLLLCYLLFVFPSLSMSDPRTSLSGLFCNPNKILTKNFVPTFVKEMQTLAKLINTAHFATFHVNITTVVPPIYGLAQCHHDLSQTDCLLCFAASRTKLPRCLPSFSARIYLDGCFLRYDNYSFYHESTSPLIDSVKCSSQNATVVSRNAFLENVGYAVGNVTRIAAAEGTGRGFGAVSVNGVYALAQCWESVGRDGCRECLEKAGKAVRGCGVKTEGRGLNAGCYLRYSDYKFFNYSDEETQEHHAYIVYARLSKIKEHNNFGLVSTSSLTKSYLSFKYETLEKATDYFNPSKKLGQGGAGSVYLGTLPNGKTIAVKRLIYNTRQWVDEFFNEVNLISKIQHKNLVKLLGVSIEGPESLLVYEYVPNKSLDQFIFDKDKTKHLNWKQRFNIIVGAAEGLAYLHEGSDIRIIHRDIKSSNILLDEDLTPKIADFGLVRCFAADMTHLSTGVAGTLGYMAPEYLVRGQLTEKADVYSFGILILEIVCGRRNNAFTQHANSPLQTVWTLYRLNQLVEAVDPNLKDDYPAKEACSALQIGLLCTQATVALRPSMAQVIWMLTDENCEIPIPNQPPFLNANMYNQEGLTSPRSTYSFITNAAAKIEVSYTSSESSSICQGSHEQSISRESTQKSDSKT